MDAQPPPLPDASGEAFRLLVESVRDYAIFLLDPSGRVASWNAGAQRIKGYTAREIIGKHFSIFYTAEAARSNHPQRELEIATQEGRYEEEGWRVRKDGTKFWANVVITALRDPAGELRGFAKVTRDMTERKQAEEALRRARDDLERRVAERTAELSRANQILQGEVERRQRLEDVLRQQAIQLQQEADRKDEFLAMLAHELRNPLGAISNALHVLTLTTPGSPAFQRARDVAARQISHHTRLVDDLLDVSRITRGKIQLCRERIDLVQLVRDAAEDHRANVESAGIRLVLELPPEAIEIVGDRIRLSQVVGNLLDNARKFTPAGGEIVVGVEMQDRRRQACVTVRDTGVGIDPAVLPRLFEPFAQADRSLDRSYGGLGLGLALVRGLAELHGGSVNVRSEGAGKGAEFSVVLPREALRSASEPATGAPGLPRQGVRVLIIEDIRDAAETLRDLLEVFGYQVEVAFDGREGLRKALELHPDVVLCDIGLPGIDGYSVASELRQDPSMALTRLIAVTGYGTDEDRRRAREAGFELHLTKPVTPDCLQQALSGVTGEEE
jgi:PAS domain S-box-containing protein